MHCLSIIGLIFNTIGGIILAYSLNRTTKMLDLSITAMEHFRDTFLAGGDILAIQGMDNHRKRALKNSKDLTLAGVILLIVGFILQLLTLLV